MFKTKMFKGKIIKNLINTAAALSAAVVIVTANGLSTHVSAVDTAGANGLYTGKTELSAGEEFTVSVVIPPAENCDTATLRVIFSENAFEVTDWAAELPGGFYNSAENFFAVSAANVERAIDLSHGLTLTAGLRVKEDAPDGIYPVILETASFCYVMDNGRDFQDVWFPETRELDLTVGAGGEFIGEHYVETAAQSELPVTGSDSVGNVNVSDSSDGQSGISTDDGSTIIIIVCAAGTVLLVGLVAAALMFQSRSAKTQTQSEDKEQPTAREEAPADDEQPPEPEPEDENSEQ